MEGKSHEEFKLKQPLLGDEKQSKEKASNNEGGGGTSFFKTCFNGLNALSGVGLLSTPYALSSGGWLSLLLLFAIAIAAFYSGLLIQRCMDMDSNITTYPDIGEQAFGNKGRILISVFMYIELFLVATGFLILEGDNLHKLLPGLEFEIEGVITGKQSLVLIVALVITPTVWLDNLNIVSYISASGVLASAIILVSIFWSGAFDGIGFHHHKDTSLVNWAGIPTAVSLYGFCYCAHPVFPTLYKSMEKKHQFSYVLIVCFILCTIGYASMAVIGYLMFGENVESQITLNLPIQKSSSRVAIYTTLVSPIAKYALMVTPMVNATKQWFPCYCNNMRPLIRLFISTTLVVCTVVVALVVPFFGSLMSLVGAFLSLSASIILPCLCYLKISGNYRMLEMETLVIVTIILMGVAIAVGGTYSAIRDLVGQL